MDNDDDEMIEACITCEMCTDAVDATTDCELVDLSGKQLTSSFTKPMMTQSYAWNQQRLQHLQNEMKPDSI